ncbi:MAG TPA: beta-ketoacyl synthase N-terminal-like domain-containing protein [Pyrinomonadaceae bacterium]
MRSSCSVIIAASASAVAESQPSDANACRLLVRTVDRKLIEEVIPPRLRKKIDRFSQVSLLAIRELQSQFSDVEKNRVGVFIGNDFAGWNYVYQQTVQMIETRDPMQIDPYVATAWFPAAAQGEITIAHGILGESKTFSAGYLGGGLALEYAARMVEAHALDVAIAGGVEAPDAPVVLQAMAIEQRISAEHPAAEAVGLLALSSSEKDGLARMTISRPRRSAEAALNDVAEKLEGATKIRYHSASVCPHKQDWNQTLSQTETLLRARFGVRLETSVPAWSGMDVGSADFSLSVVEATRSAADGIHALVLGTDFEGLHMAAAITPIAGGAF